MSEPKPIYEIHAIEQNNGDLTEVEPPLMPRVPILAVDLDTLLSLAYSSQADAVTIRRNPHTGTTFTAHFPMLDDGEKAVECFTR